MEGPNGIEASWNLFLTLCDLTGVAVHLSKIRPAGTTTGMDSLRVAHVHLARSIVVLTNSYDEVVSTKTEQ